MTARALIVGLSGPDLTDDERRFFREIDPWGFILFRRNVVDRAQVARLTAELRAAVGRRAPVLIDQEGGRVQRLAPPVWPAYPPGRAYGQLASPFARREAAWLGARLIAHDLHEVGVDVDCLPVLDVPSPGAHDVIGDRAYGDDPATVASLGRAAAEGLLSGGVLPVVKHIPGHGRAGADSHHDLPVVDAPLAELEARDFAPFRVLADMPLAMTAHVVFTAIDAGRPATTSPEVISRIIRGAIGFKGLLMSDDLSMKALRGDFAARARDSIAAGCDVVLHCNGERGEMEQIAAATPLLNGAAARRAKMALGRILETVEPLDVAAARARLAALLTPAVA
ncbi:beta-N-acetylhexosaminidase [Camelimonas lactis]|uniref:beta-N-acetylhexosaminidase n=1 Tax=Camelimonas lactis TaxID=659006 RepID=A0A4V2RXR2_9HYPH|nr:beta-N-acetylhexosaminidase [Camelimonas lactis]TCO15267.1 beta-N-acetylhexosaminidase [Camelimonas lactis]